MALKDGDLIKPGTRREFGLTERALRELEAIEAAGLSKVERFIHSPQNANVTLQDGSELLNLCANNYLGLAQHPEVQEAALEGIKNWGYGLASVRFICGTQSLHKELEARLSRFLGFEDTILYASCFDANAGLFETLLGERDAVISDELNHASIIDGVRLCKAKRYRYKNSDMADLEAQLTAARGAGAEQILITTDGVFSMDGYIAKLDQICDLADRFNAHVHVDDSHSVGFVGASGRGTHEHHDCMGRVDITTGTLGKALGGASGGYTAASKAIVELLRQRSRPYLFSNTVAPAVVAASIKALDLLEQSTALREKLMDNTQYFRSQIEQVGFDVLPGEHPIVPIMLYDAVEAAKVSEVLLKEGVYAVAFSYPVVPKGRARIRTQISAAHSQADLDHAVAAFKKAKAA